MQRIRVSVRRVGCAERQPTGDIAIREHETHWRRASRVRWIACASFRGTRRSPSWMVLTSAPLHLAASTPRQKLREVSYSVPSARRR